MATSAPLASSVPRVGVGVGVGVFILQPSTDLPSSTYACKFLLGKRLGSHGAGTWALPGGHLEYGESFEECAAREALEETGLVLDEASVEFLTATNDVMAFEPSPPSTKRLRQGGEGDARGKHYVTIFMTARVSVTEYENEKVVGSDGMPQAKLLEPEKCAGWDWVSWEDLRRWARPQLSMLDGSGLQMQAEGGEEAVGTRTLFSPLISLLVQRPDAVSRLV